MKALAVHDQAGEILSLVVSPEDGPAFGVEGQDERNAHTVELSGISFDMPESEIFQRLEEITHTYRVETTGAAEASGEASTARLVAKDSRSDA